MPISKTDLGYLFELLESTLFERRDGKIWCHCDHTLRRSREFFQSRSLPEAAIAEWLGEYGGFCDCEVAYNVADYWEKHVAKESDDATHPAILAFCGR
jgi:hypothetical protein